MFRSFVFFFRLSQRIYQNLYAPTKIWIKMLLHIIKKLSSFMIVLQSSWSLRVMC